MPAPEDSVFHHGILFPRDLLLKRRHRLQEAFLELYENLAEEVANEWDHQLSKLLHLHLESQSTR